MKERSNALIILTKFPRHGSVKTRLAAEIGVENAQKIAEVFLIDLIERFSNRNDIRLIITGAKGDRKEEFNDLFRKYGTEEDVEIIIPQSGSMEGDIISAYSYALKKSKKAVLTASDIPYLSRKMVVRMFKDLDDHDLVFHPNIDGNACPHGMKKSIDLFTGTPRRSAQYMAEWIARIRKFKLRYKVLPVLFDIDRIEDLNVFYNWQTLLKNSRKMENYCHRTMELLNKLFANATTAMKKQER